MRLFTSLYTLRQVKSISSRFFIVAIIAVTLEWPIVASLNPVVVKGNLLYDSVTKERFYIKGVTYDPIPSCGLGIDVDVIADDYVYPGGEYGSDWVSWREDLEEMAKLNVNTVRIYTVDHLKTHANFMKWAEKLGLYVLIPLTGSGFGKLDALKSSPECYTGQLGEELLFYSRSIVRQFSEYPNMLVFEAGNELLNIYSNAGNGESFPCLKSLIRDVHVFQAGCTSSMRRVPLVYSLEDLGSPSREYVGDYLTCMYESDDDVLDVMGINTYTYCKDFHEWDADNPYFEINEAYKNYASPVVFTEFGCPWGEEEVGGRKFNNVDQMMNEMQETLSGGLVYEFSNHAKPFWPDGFGVVTTKATTCSADTVTTWRSDAYRLQTKYATNAFLSHNNSQGDWTDENRCTWKPPSALEHKRPPVPVVSTMSPDSVTWSFVNWNEPLPPLPAENPMVQCPSYTLTATELKDNICFLPSTQFPTPVPTHVPTSPPSRGPTHLPVPDPTYSSSPSFSPTHSPAPLPTPVPPPKHHYWQNSTTIVAIDPGFGRAALVEITLLAALTVALFSTGVALLLKRDRLHSKEAQNVVTELVKTRQNPTSEPGSAQLPQNVMSHRGHDALVATAGVVSPFHDSNGKVPSAPAERPSWQPEVDGENESRPAWQPKVSGFYV
jgi:hypothetical protein